MNVLYWLTTCQHQLWTNGHLATVGRPASLSSVYSVTTHHHPQSRAQMASKMRTVRSHSSTSHVIAHQLVMTDFMSGLLLSWELTQTVIRSHIRHQKRPKETEAEHQWRLKSMNAQVRLSTVKARQRKLTNNFNVTSVRNYYAAMLTWSDTWKHMLVRSHTSVKRVGKNSVPPVIAKFTWKLTRVKGGMCVQYVGVDFVSQEMSEYTCKSTLVRSHLSVQYVDRGLMTREIWKFTQEPTLAKSHSSVQCVVGSLVTQATLKDILEPTQARSHMNVNCVVRDLLRMVHVMIIFAGSTRVPRHEPTSIILLLETNLKFADKSQSSMLSQLSTTLVPV